ncbi:MAG: ABC transporter ATP-binding protein [Leptolyngbyaceae cyanobacterium MO_188.B28]|nr:ABC transporter ATP-binding protein [Leptolyngbyaceae cyanobacterium MO_188.B28]
MTLMASNQKVVSTPQSDDVVLSVQGVSKKFCRDLKRSLLYGVRDIGKEFLGLRGEKNDKLRKKEFWALQDVSFELRRGEALGLVGKNGSGKSTLLRIIAGLIKPDVGMVRVNGRVAPLIALGAGFNPVLTGRENIYANMSILGLSKEEIDERFDEVVEFAEIGEAIDSPVQSYSSGMAARLGFASAIHTNPDILLIDEVLAVGDLKFRAKCNRKLFRLRQNGATFILVSHNSQVLLSACNSAIYLALGKVVTSGEAKSVVVKYENDLFLNEAAGKSKDSCITEEINNDEFREIKINDCVFIDDQGRIVELLKTSEAVTLCLRCTAYERVDEVIVRLIFRELSDFNELVLELSSKADEEELVMELGENDVLIHLSYLGLKPGLYSLRVLIEAGARNTCDRVDSFTFRVQSSTIMSNCSFYQPRSWKISNS